MRLKMHGTADHKEGTIIGKGFANIVLRGNDRWQVFCEKETSTFIVVSNILLQNLQSFIIHIWFNIEPRQ